MIEALAKRIPSKIPVIERDKYVMYLELFNGVLWFHTDIFSWTKEIKKSFINDLETISKSVMLPIKALVNENNKKLAKFGLVTHWKKEEQIVLNDGNIAYIYSWSR